MDREDIRTTWVNATCRFSYSNLREANLRNLIPVIETDGKKVTYIGKVQRQLADRKNGVPHFFALLQTHSQVEMLDSGRLEGMVHFDTGLVDPSSVEGTIGHNSVIFGRNSGELQIKYDGASNNGRDYSGVFILNNAPGGHGIFSMRRYR